MEPASISILGTALAIALIGGGGVSASVLLGALLNWLTSGPQPPQISPPQDGSSDVDEEGEEVDPNQPGDAPGTTQEERVRDALELEQERAVFLERQRTWWRTVPPDLQEAVDRLTANVRVTAKRELVGYRKTGERFLGMKTVEVLHPGTDMAMRPMRDMSELGQLAMTELGMPRELLNARIAMGEAMVRVNTVDVPLMEDTHDPQFTEHVKMIYVLLDVSPSMSNEQGAWRIPFWKAIVRRMLVQAIRGNATFVMRMFDERVYGQVRVVNGHQAQETSDAIEELSESGSGTDIGHSLLVAISDFEHEDYDEAEVVLVTDGEDNRGLDPAVLRPMLEAANLRLTALMLGIDNTTLRDCCDLYQIVHPDGRVIPPVKPHHS